MHTTTPQPVVPLVDRAAAVGSVREDLDAISQAFGAVPAMFGAVANSPATLSAMWSAFGAYAGGALGPQLGEQIAVAVANANRCGYCLAAHTALGRKAGLSGDELAAAQSAGSDDPAVAALLAFALSIVERRGQVDVSQIAGLREHGWNDEQIVETIGQVALNVFTNYVNLALGVPVDFPAVTFAA